MDARDALCALQRALAEALVAGDPDAFCRASTDLPAELRRACGRIDTDGFRIASLLVARLRFQRLMHGSRRASEMFDRDPAAFAGSFERYHRSVPPRDHDPWNEAATFEAWLDREEPNT